MAHDLTAKHATRTARTSTGGGRFDAAVAAVDARLLAGVLPERIEGGTLRLIDHRDHVLTLGGGARPQVTVKLHDARVPWAIALDPHLKLGEAYAEGRLTVEQGTLYDLLELVRRNFKTREYKGGRLIGAMARARARARQLQPAALARKRVAHHYDLSRRLYELFLDEDLQYSCGYFRDQAEPLEEAQANKKRLIAAKLCLEPGQRVLDIGCGWGGLAMHLAREHGVLARGITLSEEQREAARERIAAEGLASRVAIDLADYRALEGSYDRIVSVGMFEHVGLPHYRRFFEVVARRLTDDGAALIHTIGRSDGPSWPSPFFDKYIFPGGYAPALSEIIPAIEASGLVITDIEVWRLHYAHTLRHWRARFAANRGEARALYDERFCRIWEYYLTASEVAFRDGAHVVFQIQLAKRQDAVPITRDYLESAFAAAVPVPRNGHGGQKRLACPFVDHRRPEAR